MQAAWRPLICAKKQTAIDCLCSRKMMITDRLAGDSGATVNRQPELIFPVSLRQEEWDT
jgi:hypothetical protein